MKEQKSRLYDSYVTGVFATSYTRFEEADYRDAARGLAGIYGRFLPPDRNAKILDAGCGPGYFVYTLRSFGYTDVLGIDLSKEQVDLAQRAGLNVRRADAFEFLHGADSEYDLIVSTAFLEHLTRDEAVNYLSLVRGALKPGGRFICCVPNANSPFGARLRYKDLTHEQSFTEDSLRQLFVSAGLQAEHIGDENLPVFSIAGHARRLVSRAFRVFWRLFMIAELGREAYGVPLDYKLVGACRKI